MKLKVMILPLCECQRQMLQLSRPSANSDGDVWDCSYCKRSYFIAHTYVDAAAMSEMRTLPSSSQETPHG